MGDPRGEKEKPQQEQAKTVMSTPEQVRLDKFLAETESSTKPEDKDINIEQEYNDTQKEISEKLIENFPDLPSATANQIAKKSIDATVGMIGRVRKYVMEKVAPLVAFATITGAAGYGGYRILKSLEGFLEGFNVHTGAKYVERDIRDERWDNLLSIPVETMNDVSAKTILDEDSAYRNGYKYALKGTPAAKRRAAIADKATEITNSDRFKITEEPTNSINYSVSLK